MSWPTNPTNNQETTVNGILFRYNSTAQVWNRVKQLAASTAGSSSFADTAGTVTTAAQPNITSVGTLSSVAVTANATVGNLVVNGGILSNRANVSVSTNTVIDEFSPSTFRSAKYVISASGSGGYQSVETLLVHDGTNSYITIYGSVCSNATVDTIDITSNINNHAYLAKGRSVIFFILK